jgi:hypothetical protein
MAEDSKGALGTSKPTNGPVGFARNRWSWWPGSPGRRQLASELVSLSNLIGRPIRDLTEGLVARVTDVVVHWEAGTTHPVVSGVLARVGRGVAMVPIDEVTITQSGVKLRSLSLAIGAPKLGDNDVALARDVLDHQLVDVTGVQVVRASDVYLVRAGQDWELAGVDVGAWALLRRLLPKRRRCPLPDRAIDWSDLQAFVARFPDEATADPQGPANAAGTGELGVRLAYRADALRKLRAKDVAALLSSLERGPQAQLAAMADPPAAAEALAELSPEKLDALLSELDEGDRARLQGLLARRPQ